MRGNEFQRRVGESVEFVDLEAGRLNGRAAVTVEVTATPYRRPHWCDRVLEDSEQRAAGTDVFEEPQFQWVIARTARKGSRARVTVMRR
ncbi:MAG: hypothetical protein ACRDU5_08330 [Mycobacterium sp.]